jgi:hypothetical protein
MRKNRTFIYCYTLGMCFKVLSLSSQTPAFGIREDRGLIRHSNLKEISGIIASRANANVLWVHNDSGDESVLYAINTKGEHLGKYRLRGITARDWEDIALGSGPQPDVDYLYIGDFGDNDYKYDCKYIYRVPEPEVHYNQTPVSTFIDKIEILVFQFPNGRKNAETLLIDPISKDIYILSKSDSIAEVYCTINTFSKKEPITLNYLGTISVPMAVGGDISPSGKEILIKNYFSVFYWKREPDNTIWEALQKEFKIIPYIPEPQGEAICWKFDGSGYYTVSEERAEIEAHLYFYPKLK